MDTIISLFPLINLIERVLFFISFLLVIRIYFVSKFRMYVLSRIYTASLIDFESVKKVTFFWRILRYFDVSYTQMIWKFWKPLEIKEWWVTDDFIRPSQKEIENK